MQYVCPKKINKKNRKIHPSNYRLNVTKEQHKWRSQRQSLNPYITSDSPTQIFKLELMKNQFS